MLEAAGGLVIVPQQVIHEAAALLDEGGLRRGVAAQGRQGDDGPDVRLRAAEAALLVLLPAQEGQRVVHHGLDLGVRHCAAQGRQLAAVEVVRGQRVHRRGGDIKVARLAADGPAAVFKLVRLQRGDEGRAGRVALVGVQIAVGVQRQQREGRAVVALPLCPVGSVVLFVQQRAHQVIDRARGGKLRRVITQTGQGDHHAAVLGVLLVVQLAAAVIHIGLQTADVLAVPVGLRHAAAVEGKDRPLALGGAHAGVRDLLGHVSLNALQGLLPGDRRDRGHIRRRGDGRVGDGRRRVHAAQRQGDSDRVLAVGAVGVLCGAGHGGRHGGDRHGAGNAVVQIKAVHHICGVSLKGHLLVGRRLVHGEVRSRRLDGCLGGRKLLRCRLLLNDAVQRVNDAVIFVFLRHGQETGLRVGQGLVMLLDRLQVLLCRLAHVTRQGCDLCLEVGNCLETVHSAAHVLQRCGIDLCLLARAQHGDHGVDVRDLLPHRLIVVASEILHCRQRGN